ncbi:16S rRNA (cytidine(1402)-2'-O)-methyltransferase [Ancylobacter sp. 6x-1]|uniref:Ribosomal RNA small subunit methyltransferase I n=1 Tax=Ancylobacter crimeensis TaxID=2579147 RepID=A0ABT0DBX8_9HYPH|nr:16S rRNA (cytidine(1402)-2'-O)-methyltransferase [Ancylobacter crimeensis]MCK0197466.1 16S rRNA (cytidine(1402)-2'-O)-methyltransferase [Ancylobacter crimeensis]
MTRTDAPLRPPSFQLAGQIIPAERLSPGLHVVATPIGNLGDITLRALGTLAGADVVACEDTRITRRLFDRYGIATPLVAYHEHNAESMRPRLMARIAEGAAVALVSDAGTPLVSDPGFKLVGAAIDAGYRVFPLPGASASLAALVAAGLPTDRFFFEGFLPPKSGARRSRIAELKALPATLVLYETGPRLAESLADLASGLGPRPAAVCRELTKAFEEVRRAALPDLAAHYETAGAPKGEIVLVIGPPEEAVASDDEIDAALNEALRTLSVKDAAAAVSAATGRPRREVYARALARGGAREPRGGARER